MNPPAKQAGQSGQAGQARGAKSNEAREEQAIEEQAKVAEKDLDSKILEAKEVGVKKTAVDESAVKTPDPKQQFNLARGLHVWARFEPGAWRELEIATETFDESGQVESRNITLLKERLMQVDNGKYVLNVQATVDLGGKKIVGDWKTRILNLVTDHAELVTETRRLKDQSFQLTGQTVACQVWEIYYHDGNRKLFDRIHFSAQQFPYILCRETLIDQRQQNGVELAAAPSAEETTEQVIEVTAPVLPYRMGDQFLACSNMLRYRLHFKGDSHRAVIVNEAVPGGMVEKRSTDYDADGHIVRWSITKLLDFGTDSPDEKEQPTANKIGLDKTEVEKEINGETSVEENSTDEISSDSGTLKRKSRLRRRFRKN